MNALTPKNTVYPIEPVMHAGKVYVPGDSMDCDPDDTAAILTSGRGTLDIDVARQAAKLYAAQQMGAV